MTRSEPTPHRTKPPPSVASGDTPPPLRGVADGREPAPAWLPSATPERGGGGSGVARDGGGAFSTPGPRQPTADYFPDRAPLDHVPVHPTADPRLPTAGFRAVSAILLAALALLGGALLGKCWPW